jgi:hypothetical protein
MHPFRIASTADAEREQLMRHRRAAPEPEVFGPPHPTASQMRRLRRSLRVALGITSIRTFAAGWPYTKAELIKMDGRFCAAMMTAIAAGLELPPALGVCKAPCTRHPRTILAPSTTLTSNAGFAA